MSQITITVPDNQDARIVNAFAAEFGWKQESGLTKVQFFKRKVIDYIKDIVKKNEAFPAMKVTEQNVISDVNSIDIS